MEFTFNLSHRFGAAGLIVEAILLSIAGIVALIIFIVFRRWYRGRYFAKVSECTYLWRSRWEQLVAGKLPDGDWRTSRLNRDILEGMLLDAIEADTGNHQPGLLQCLRSSALLDFMIRDARRERSWKRRTALIALGRTRAPEALPALTEALDSRSQETRIAAVRALERTGLVNAALPILDRLVAEQLDVPEHTVKNALVSCCRVQPSVLVGYLQHATGTPRELIARVLGEIATSEHENELLFLSADPLPEVRASAARALGNARPIAALSILADLAKDPEWFVRLRAVIALGSLPTPLRIRPLLRALTDSVPAVRKRAAWALSAIAPGTDAALERLVDQEDGHLAQQFIAQFESSDATDLASHANLGSRLADILSRSLTRDSKQLGTAARAGVP